MLPKQNRVSKKGLEEIFKKGKVINSPLLTFRFLLSSEQFLPRVSFIVPKSVAKLAVKRNLLRRLGYVAITPYIKDLPDGLQGVFVFKKYQDNVLMLENEIKGMLAKIN